MVLILRTCGAYHPHHWCIPSAPHVLSIRTKPVEYQYTTHMIRYRTELFNLIDRVYKASTFYN